MILCCRMISYIPTVRSLTLRPYNKMVDFVWEDRMVVDDNCQRTKGRVHVTCHIVHSQQVLSLIP